jgi:hypothetical protein
MGRSHLRRRSSPSSAPINVGKMVGGTCKHPGLMAGVFGEWFRASSVGDDCGVGHPVE